MAGVPAPGIDDGSKHAAIGYVVAVFTGIAWFNSVELIILILVTFNRYKGLYFWSLLVSSIAVLPYQLGFLLYFFQLTSNNYLSFAIVNIGWAPMVTGQSIVLYSRLHLVSQDTALLRKIKYLIGIDAVLFHIPTIVISFLAIRPSGGGSTTERGAYSIMEKIQMTAFCLQEFAISAVYLRETVRLIKMSFREHSRKVMWQLVWINLIIIVLDLVLLGIEYASLYTLETTLKGVVYSVKLRLEFAVLSQLVSFTSSSKQASVSTAFTQQSGVDQRDFGSSVKERTPSLQALPGAETLQAEANVRNTTDTSTYASGNTTNLHEHEPSHDLSADIRGGTSHAETSPPHRASRRSDELWIQDFAYRESV